MSSSEPVWEMIDFVVPMHECDLISDALWGLGVVAIEERESVDGFTTLRTSMGDNPDDAIAQVLFRFPSITAQKIEIQRSVADSWREHATPTWVTEQIALVPAWLTPPDGCIPILIEPHDTFGLGNHPTTVLALRLALRHVQSQSKIYDMGCGSGVLAIALAKLSGCTAYVYDIAQGATAVVANNCQLNSVVTVHWQEDLEHLNVDAMLANILAPVLKELSEPLQRSVRSGGVVILSGMRTEQVQDVVSLYSDCSEISRETQDGWTAVALQKK